MLGFFLFFFSLGNSWRSSFESSASCPGPTPCHFCLLAVNYFCFIGNKYLLTQSRLQTLHSKVSFCDTRPRTKCQRTLPAWPPYPTMWLCSKCLTSINKWLNNRNRKKHTFAWNGTVMQYNHVHFCSVLSSRIKDWGHLTTPTVTPTSPPLLFLWLRFVCL